MRRTVSRLLCAVATAFPVATAQAQHADVLISSMRRAAEEAPPFMSIEMRGQTGFASAREQAPSSPLHLGLGTPALRWRGAEWQVHGGWMRGLQRLDSTNQAVDVATSARWRLDGVPVRLELGYRALDRAGDALRVQGALEPVQISRRLRFSASLELFRGDPRTVRSATDLSSDTGVVVVPDTGAVPRELNIGPAMLAVTSAALGASWRGVDFDLRAWQRLPLGLASRRELASRLEAALETNVPLSSRTALVGMVANRSYGGEAPGPHFALGLRWSTGRRLPPATRRAPTLAVCDGTDAATALLRVHAPRAKRVEIEGDPTGWAPRLMLPSMVRDWWELPVSSFGGVQRVRVRIDGGAWIAPSGLPTERSEFGGELGVLRGRMRDGRCASVGGPALDG